MEKETNLYGSEDSLNKTDYTAFTLTAAILEAAKTIVAGEESTDLIKALVDGAELIEEALDVLQHRQAKRDIVPAFPAMLQYNDFISDVCRSLETNTPLPLSINKERK